MVQLSSRRLAAAVAAICLATYAAAARGFGNLYPFSTVDMYARTSTASVSRVGVRTANGSVSEVTLWSSWQCPDTWRQDIWRACGSANDGYEYLHRVVENHIRRESVPDPTARAMSGGGVSVEVIRRRWIFASDGSAPHVRDCVIARCIVRRSDRGEADGIALDVFDRPPEAPRSTP